MRFGGYNKTNTMRERRLGVPFAPRLEQNHISRYTNHLEEKHESESNRDSVTRTVGVILAPLLFLLSPSQFNLISLLLSLTVSPHEGTCV
ncbi:hypothetical protein EON65_11805 [archaeon]|nr:MAG: hypothetical protein EON65_11805 [archaeon]